MKTLKLTLALIFFCCYTHAALAIDLSKRPDIQAYIEHISQKYDFNAAELTNYFNQVHFFKMTAPKVKPAKPSKPTPYYVYRRQFIPSRIQPGVAYHEEHSARLHATEKHYGVPRGVILGILGIETGYGVNTGHSSAFQGLVTLAFNHPYRRDYFRSELTSYLLLCRERNWNPLRVQSSFDGGLGLPQFMPSSYREYAVRAFSDGRKPNLFENDDAIASIGNYLRAKGWQADMPIISPAKIINPKLAHHIPPEGTKTKLTLAELKSRYGVVPSQKEFPSHLKANVLFLQTHHGKAQQPWIAFENFSVIKRYNNSTNYAMTVYELGKIISQQRS